MIGLIKAVYIVGKIKKTSVIALLKYLLSDL